MRKHLHLEIALIIAIIHARMHRSKLRMKKFKIPSYIFYFIDELMLANGEIALSRKIPSNDVTNKTINTFQKKSGTTGLGIFIFDIKGWVGDYVVECPALLQGRNFIH